nr:MAG TPA: hypothetical protein [Caudoviricetes sp.]
MFSINLTAYILSYANPINLTYAYYFIFFYL